MKHLKLFENWAENEETQEASYMYDADNLADPSEEPAQTYAGDYEEETPEEETADFKAEYDPYDYEAEEAEEEEGETEEE